MTRRSTPSTTLAPTAPGRPLSRATRPRTTPRSAAIDQLRPLLSAAADLDLDDREAVDELRDAAHRVTTSMVASGTLPTRLLVTASDSPASVARILTDAWRGSTEPAQLRSNRY